MRGIAVGTTAEREELLAAAVVEAVEGTSAYAGSVFLRSRDRRSIVLAATCGVPPSLLGGWRLIPVSSPIPVATAYSSGRTVHLADAEETMRRYPQLAVALPYAFGSCSVPVGAGGETFGSLAIIWAASPGGAGLSKAQRRHVRTIANRLGASLAALRARIGDPVECAPETTPVENPAPSAPAVRVGLFDWDLISGMISVDDEFCTIFDLDPRTFDGQAKTLHASLHPGDLAAFRFGAGEAASGSRTTSRRLRIRDHRYGGDGYRTVELWGRVPEADDAEPRTHLVGAIVDARAGSTALAAVERLRDGLFSLAPDGRVTYANHSALQLLDVSDDELLGRILWDVLPWLSDPDVESRHRSAMIAQAPASFLACPSPDRWLAFSLHPEADGVTGRVVPLGQPPSASTPSASSASSTESPTAATPTRLGVMHHVLQLGSALTEAVTTREVCEVVSDQLLPAFGGQQLAIYVVRNKTMHLLFHTGHHEDFLDWLEGAPLHARLPGTEALTSGAPLFIESRQDLSQNYPDIPTGEVRSWVYLPLIASSHPVGICVLGFDTTHQFTERDRGVLTALAGLIGQALERAQLYDSEFAIARGLQQALLPHRLPAIPGIRTVARYLPGTSGMDIGGDWYDVIPTTNGVSLIIGDVQGHSIAAAATMAQLRSAVRSFTAVGHAPGEVMAGVNRTLIDLDSGLLASCCCIHLEPRTHHAQAVTAGHPPPLLRRPDGTTDVLDLDVGPLLGVERASAYPGTRIALPPGSVLALYTDGLVEEPGADIDVGIDRLRASLAHARSDSLDELAGRLLHNARRSSYRADDIALLLTETAYGSGQQGSGGTSEGPCADRPHDSARGPGDDPRSVTFGESDT
ncbi:SpoIIE family protein phosphatase [Streptomyces nigrescens]